MVKSTDIVGAENLIQQLAGYLKDPKYKIPVSDYFLNREIMGGRSLEIYQKGTTDRVALLNPARQIKGVTWRDIFTAARSKIAEEKTYSIMPITPPITPDPTQPMPAPVQDQIQSPINFKGLAILGLLAAAAGLIK